MATNRAYIPALINLAWIGSFVLLISISSMLNWGFGLTRQVSPLDLIQPLHMNSELGVSSYLLAYCPLTDRLIPSVL